MAHRRRQPRWRQTKWRLSATLVALVLVGVWTRPAAAPSISERGTSSTRADPSARTPPAPRAPAEPARRSVADGTLERAAADAMVGRWDITIRTPDGDRPSWLEIKRSGRESVVGQFVGVVGSARPVARIVASGDSLRFSIPPQWEEGAGDLAVEGRLEGDRLAGRMTFPDGKRYDWTAVRAPSLRRAAPTSWSAPIRLLRRNSLRGWRAVGGENQWTVTNGILRSPKSGANLMTERTFRDFRLHIEFRYPKGGNSGVYLRGRHEVQIEDNFGMDPASDRFGGVYGFISPSTMAARRPGEWQSYEITLVGRMVTVVANGRMIICNREIPGITGGALDSNEGEPGPILLQGDHGPIEYRNITVRVPR